MMGPANTLTLIRLGRAVANGNVAKVWRLYLDQQSIEKPLAAFHASLFPEGQSIADVARERLTGMGDEDQDECDPDDSQHGSTFAIGCVEAGLQEASHARDRIHPSIVANLLTKNLRDPEIG